MTYPQPDGTQDPEPPTHVPNTPPPYTGVAPDLGIPAVPFHQPPIAPYQPPASPPAGAYQPPASPYSPPSGAFPPPPSGAFQAPPAPYQPAGAPPWGPSPAAASPWAQSPADAYGGPRLVSPGGRLGAQLLDGLLIFVTAGIGWLIWAVLVFDQGRTPARQLLGHVVADAATGEPVTWARMAVREVVLKGLLGYFASAFTCGIYYFADSLMVFGQRYQTLHDRIAGTIVIHG